MATAAILALCAAPAYALTIAEHVDGLILPRVPAPVADPSGPRHPAPIPVRTSIPLGAAVAGSCAGAAIGPAALACPAGPFTPGYLAAWKQRFDRLSPENELKMLFTQPARGRFDFAAADRVVGLAAAERREVRGHTLIYPAANPRWVDRGPLLGWSRVRLLRTMRTHISKVMGHFGSVFPGTIRQWDVVNEPFRGNGARDDNVYQRIIGDDWIEQAFRAANAADPRALLFLNEFAADEHGRPRQKAVAALARDFVVRGVPIDGIGLEMHIGANGRYPTRASLVATMKEYADLGLRVEVTELDVLPPTTDDGGVAQRRAYQTVGGACRRSPNCTGVTVWGVADPYSWRGAARKADLLDASFGPKPAYADVRCRLANPWPTAAAPAVDPCAVTDPALIPGTPSVPGSPDGSSQQSQP